MNRLNWLLTRSVEQLPVLALLSWATLSFIVWFSMSLLWASHQQLSELKTRPVAVSERQPVMPKVPEQTLFFKQMPPVKAVSDAIHDLFNIAGEQGVSLEQVTYNDEVKTGEPVLRYMISFGLQGDYQSIKRFLADLLIAQPYLALQQMSFEREQVDDRDVNAQLKMSLFLNHE